MAMKTILLPLETGDGLQSMLETAWLAATAFGSTIQGLYIRRALPGVVVADIGGYAAAAPDLVESFEAEDRERGAQARRTFEEFLRGKGVALGEPGPSDGTGTGPGGEDRPSATWAEEIPPGDAAVGMYARMFDLTVVGRPVQGASAPAASTLETVLFDSGRPILIAPPTVPASLGRTAVVSWNGSTETARTVAFAMPLLRRAERVVVLAVEGVMVPGPSAAEAARHLQLNGIDAETREAATNGRGGGETILAEAAALGADLLVKGAYTNSRLRQMIFGGATSQILAEAELPVFMAH
jgi:nucleotide-binding universal stress UspA family protein